MYGPTTTATTDSFFTIRISTSSGTGTGDGYYNRTYRLERYGYHYLSFDEPALELESKRSAHAVPPQPPPVSLDLASVRVKRRLARNPGVTRCFTAPILRLHDRQRTNVRSRRKRRTWER